MGDRGVKRYRGNGSGIRPGSRWNAKGFCNHLAMKKFVLPGLLAITTILANAACVTNKAAPEPGVAPAATTTTTESQEVHTY